MALTSTSNLSMIPRSPCNATASIFTMPWSSSAPLLNVSYFTFLFLYFNVLNELLPFFSLFNALSIKLVMYFQCYVRFFGPMESCAFLKCTFIYGLMLSKCAIFCDSCIVNSNCHYFCLTSRWLFWMPNYGRWFGLCMGIWKNDGEGSTIWVLLLLTWVESFLRSKCPFGCPVFSILLNKQESSG